MASNRQRVESEVRSKGRGFDSHPGHRCVVTLGKLSLHTHILVTKQLICYWPKSGDVL